jgi:AcrR family transcriptional regulator
VASSAERIGDGDADPPRDQRLPAGHHGLERRQVVASQRRRLLAATALAVVEVGYGDLTVAEIVKRAGVSRVTFYQLFDGKTAVIVASFDQAFEDLQATIGATCARRCPWPENLLGALEAVAGFAAASPAEAGLLSANPIGVERALADRVRAANRQLAELLRETRPPSPHSSEPPAPLIEEALIGAAAALIADRLAGEGEAALAALAPQLSLLFLTSYLGPSEARTLLGAKRGATEEWHSPPTEA